MTRLLVSFVALAITSTTAFAEDRWSESSTFTHSDVTSIRVAEPEGYKVSIKIGDEVQTDTVPVVFRAPLADAYYSMTIVAPNGAAWTKKIATRRYNVTEVTVSHVADDKAPAKSARKFIGSMFNDASGCNIKATMKIELIAGDGTVVATSTLKNGYSQEQSIASGTYDIRVYSMQKDRWTYETTGKANVDSDKWKITSGCSNEGVGVWFEK